MSAYQKYTVVRKTLESDLVVSIYLKPLDGGVLAPYRPGQHLQFRLTIPGQGVALFRNYSFSDVYRSSCYRVSVKKELPPRHRPDLPAGLGSSYFFDTLREGDVLEAKGPQGSFYLDPAADSPVVFFAGGIGITPLLSMVGSIALVNPRRRVYFIYGVNEKKDHSFRGELEQLRKAHPAFQFLIFYSVVGEGDREGVDFDHAGFIDMEVVLKRTGDPGMDMDHYICGPGVMMDSIKASLLRLGVEESRIHIEAFNAPPLERREEEEEAKELKPIERKKSTDKGKPVAAAVFVGFARSGKRIAWDPRYPSILAFAEDQGIDIPSGCLFGDCGTCQTKLQSGDVRYLHPTMVKPDAGTCLPCSCVPVNDVTLDA
ncbi:MAG TPA: 2Fe-2S iron-sulfur cluster-binding protein [Puia sp.]|jgi:ferredoxin-NADP reductase